MPQQFELIEHDGRLAVVWDVRDAPDRPVTVVTVKVGPRIGGPDSMTSYRDLVGARLTVGPHGHLYCYRHDAAGYAISVPTVFPDVHKWPEAAIKSPVKRPRNGREYTWKWQADRSGRAGRWERVEFPRCGICDQYHDPTYIYCELETCGREWTCHPAGRHTARSS